MESWELTFENITINVIDEDGDHKLNRFADNANVSFRVDEGRFTIAAKSTSGAELLSIVCRLNCSDIAKVGRESILISPGGERLSYLFRLPTEYDMRSLYRRFLVSKTGNSGHQQVIAHDHESMALCNGMISSDCSDMTGAEIEISNTNTATSNTNLNSNSNATDKENESIFWQRTDIASADQYFQFYSLLAQQQNMLQDYIRTATYQRAILSNPNDFKDKVVLDVGAGSGILSFFAVQAGAKKVYAVEASSVARHCETLIRANRLAGKIVIVSGKVEEIELPEKVDVIISEPMGYMLFNERMLETYLHAKKWLKSNATTSPDGQPCSTATVSEMSVTTPTDSPSSSAATTTTNPTATSSKPQETQTNHNKQQSRQKLKTKEGLNDDHEYSNSVPEAVAGQMFPSRAELHVVPFTDDALYMEVAQKANFWYQQNFHGVDLSALREHALRENFRQPVVDTFDVRIAVAASNRYHVNFLTDHESDLHRIDIPLQFQILQTCTVHGLAFWFDVCFQGTQQTVWLSTSPTEPLTHWYQIRCLLLTPVFVQQGTMLRGRVLMRANTRQSYDLDIELCIPNTAQVSRNTIDLKNPLFRYTGQATLVPPGALHQSATEAYWHSLQATMTDVNTPPPECSATAISASETAQHTASANSVNMMNAGNIGIQQQQYNNFMGTGAVNMNNMNGFLNTNMNMNVAGVQQQYAQQIPTQQVNNVYQFIPQQQTFDSAAVNQQQQYVAMSGDSAGTVNTVAGSGMFYGAGTGTGKCQQQVAATGPVSPYSPDHRTKYS